MIESPQHLANDRWNLQSMTKGIFNMNLLFHLASIHPVFKVQTFAVLKCHMILPEHSMQQFHFEAGL